jgi:hypothetical protein
MNSHIPGFLKIHNNMEDRFIVVFKKTRFAGDTRERSEKTATTPKLNKRQAVASALKFYVKNRFVKLVVLYD